MSSRKKGTRHPLLEREKLTIVRYCEDVNSEKPNFLTKEIYEKAARIFDVITDLSSKFLISCKSFVFRFTLQPCLK
jgi:hypothetical protein